VYDNGKLTVPVKLCYIDAFSGVSGDMLVGALADAGADSHAITAAISSLGIGVDLAFEKVKRGGISATKFNVSGGVTAKHRHLPHILAMIERGDFSAQVKRNSSAVFRRLGEAEAAVHGVPIEKVHFHEVGAADSIADIVGACAGFDLLGVNRIVCSALNVGSGTVETEHGVLPVPAPATAALLASKPVYSRGPAMELTTPTGAAVVATLAEEFGPMPAMAVDKIGYGAGFRDFHEHANVLRLMLGQPSGAAEATTITVMEANVDDLSPEVLAYAAERLLGAGALDVSLSPIQMKKGRPGSLLRVLAKPEDREVMARLIFSETSTLGLRMYSAERLVQARDWVQVATQYGMVRIKVSGDGCFAPEYDDCRKLAQEKGVALKQVMAEANLAYSRRHT